jgi:LysM repeat protein
MKTRKILFGVTAILTALVLSSCKTAPVRTTTYIMPDYNLQIAPSALGISPGQTVYHAVAPGETLWRISKMYDVKVEDVMRANGLAAGQAIEIGQRLLIPSAASAVPRPVISLYSSDKWQYIIIHHSATEEGNALEFNKAHNTRGFQGIGYDFVIDNGSMGKSDGQIETAPRWTKQQDGAYCIASGMNHRGIGICLVGNFSKDPLSEKQMTSLVYLVNTLRDYYKISPKRIMGHCQVYGARTECPGARFPWSRFFQRLDDAQRGI